MCAYLRLHARPTALLSAGLRLAWEDADGVHKPASFGCQVRSFASTDRRTVRRQKESRHPPHLAHRLASAPLCKVWLPTLSAILRPLCYQQFISALSTSSLPLHLRCSFLACVSHSRSSSHPVATRFWHRATAAPDSAHTTQDTASNRATVHGTVQGERWRTAFWLHSLTLCLCLFCSHIHQLTHTAYSATLSPLCV